MVGCVVVLLGLLGAGVPPLRGSGPRSGPVTALVFSPDGKLLLSGGYRAVTVRSVPDGRVTRTVECGLAQVHDLAFSPDGKMLAVAGGTPGSSGEVRLLAWPEGREVARRQEFRDLAMAVAFSPSGSWVAAASADGTARLWPVGEAAASKLIEGATGPALCAAFDPEGRTLVTGGVDRSLRVVEVPSGRLIQNLTNHLGSIHSLAFRPGAAPGREPDCATGSEDRTVRVWQPRIGRMVRIIRQHEGPVLAVAWSRDGTRLFAAGTDGRILAFDGNSDKRERAWRAHDGWIDSLAASPTAPLLASGDAAGNVRLWNSDTGEPAPSR